MSLAVAAAAMAGASAAPTGVSAQYSCHQRLHVLPRTYLFQPQPYGYADPRVLRREEEQRRRFIEKYGHVQPAPHHDSYTRAAYAYGGGYAVPPGAYGHDPGVYGYTPRRHR